MEPIPVLIFGETGPKTAAVIFCTDSRFLFISKFWAFPLAGDAPGVMPKRYIFFADLPAQPPEVLIGVVIEFG